MSGRRESDSGFNDDAPLEGLISYAFSEKSRWRQWAWKQVRRRLARSGIKPWRARVAFLAAHNLLDVEQAERIGFKRANLLAVTRDAAVVSWMRSQGVTSVCVDAAELFLAMPPCMRLDGVILDFCSGINSDSFTAVLASLGCPAPDHFCIVVNLLRGRDAPSNEIRKWSTTALCGGKHRGRIVAEYVQSYWATGVAAAQVGMNPHDLRLGADHATAGRLADEYGKRAMRIMRLDEFSYRSVSRQTFDSVAFTRPPGLLNSCGSIAELSWYRDARRKLIAAAAVMTTRRKLSGLPAQRAQAS